MYSVIYVIGLPGLHHIFDEGGDAGEVGGGALEAVYALPSAADTV